MDEEDPSDIILEYLEVFINHILYVRNLYPKQIFIKKRIYNAPVYVSIYPPLNEYILKILKTARELIRNKTLRRIEFIIYENDILTYENYIFEIEDGGDNNPRNTKDSYLIKFEEELRKSLLTLENRIKILQELPKTAKFKVYFHTTQSSFVKLSHLQEFQEDFPWVQETETIIFPEERVYILPICKTHSTGIQVYAEKY